MTQVWRKSDATHARATQVWCKCDASVTQVWRVCGASVNHVWLKRDKHVAQVIHWDKAKRMEEVSKVLQMSQKDNHDGWKNKRSCKDGWGIQTLRQCENVSLWQYAYMHTYLLLQLFSYLNKLRKEYFSGNKSFENPSFKVSTQFLSCSLNWNFLELSVLLSLCLFSNECIHASVVSHSNTVITYATPPFHRVTLRMIFNAQ